MIEKSLASVVSAFGTACKAKLANKAAVGAPEDQLRAPLEHLFKGLAEVVGLAPGDIAFVGENTIADLKSRADYAVTLRNTLVGFIEIKAPGKGADPRRFTDEHDKKQWAKLKSLPNLLYTDGNAFSLWRDGVLQGTVVALDGDVTTTGGKLAAPPTLPPLVSDFLRWSPIAPRTVKQLAETAARLCRLLRDEVAEELERENKGLTSLAEEWRGLLFPQASDAEFADGYAQAVTFGLLVARTRGIALSGGIEHAAVELRKANSLIGTALRLLTDNEDVRLALDSALRTLARVLDAVDWPALTKGDVDAWLYFYEDFLAVYDNALRKRTGSYYTPPQVVEAMVRLVDEALRDPDLFGLPQGLASSDVVLADPAMGTGAYLLGALRSIAQTVEADLGAGAVPGAVAAAAKRLIGFEMQFGPFAVAQLRLVAEMQTLMNGRRSGALPELRLFITDTLGDPYATQTQFSAMTEPIGESRRKANAIKRDERITVVIGNPPYKVDAAGHGGWIEDGTEGRASALDLWSPPPEWGVGAHAKHLKNLYVYFWRWATWKVFGAGHAETTGEPAFDRAGIVCFITAAGFLNGPGFMKMREDLRRECDAIWVIDCSPEGHQPEVATRIFQGVQQTICIVLAARTRANDSEVPARVLFRALPKARREVKFATLAEYSTSDPAWIEADPEWTAPFLPARTGDWASFTPLASLFVWSSPGVKTHRTWVVAPDAESLASRWIRLRDEGNPTRKDEYFHPDRDRTLLKVVRVDLGTYKTRPVPIDKDNGPVVPPIRYGFRSFDRQWIIPDHRLLSQGRSELWGLHGKAQLYLTALDGHSPSNGPALSFTNLIPDNDHYKGSFGGRVFALWRDAAATVPNVKPEFLANLSLAYGRAVGPEDVVSYIAAVLAHPAFTARFQADLVRPGLRVPLTADAVLFDEAVRLGREVIWLHCYGERFADPANGRPAGPPRLPKAEAPTIPKGGAIPGAPEPLPDTMDYDPAARRLRVGAGHVDNVPAAVWAYEVSGKNVLHQWFSYRKRDRSRPIIGDRRPPSPLDKVQPDHWLDEYTTDLMNLLHVLGRLVKLEPAQADLLDRICAAPLLPAALPEPPPATTPPAA